MSLKPSVVELLVSSVRKIEATIMGFTKRKAEDNLAGSSRASHFQVLMDYKGHGHQDREHHGNHNGHYSAHRGGVPMG